MVVIAALLAGCAPAPVTVQGQDVSSLYWLFMAGAALVFVVVAGLIGWSIVRYRAPQDADLPPQTHANVRLELIWWALPTILVIILFFLTAGVLNRVDARANEGESLVVRVTGFQWQWQFDYEEAGVVITGTPDEPPIVVLPVDRPLTFLLDSPDVIHSFFVPQFLFKRDVIPGIENRVDLTIQEPATYTGQCAEFCGLQHGRMKVRVVALSQPDWETWVQNHKQPAVTPSDGSPAAQGMDLFMGQLSGGRGSCVACHAIGGTEASSPAAPNLTHFADPTHQCFAGCNWETTDEAALRAWLRDPNAVKLGAKMPNYHLSDEEIDALVAYLMSLR